MPVNIVSTPSTATQTTVSDAAGADTATSEDFANMLQDQLALNAGQTPAETIVASLPALAADSVDDNDASEALGALDPTTLLATLALVTPQVSNAQPTPVSAETEQSASAPLAALSATAVQGKEIATQEPSEAQQDAAKPTTTTSTGESAAKFAVATADTESDPVAVKVASDTASGDIAATSDNVHTNIHAAASRNSAATEATLTVATPVRNQDWSGDFGQKVVWLATSDTQSAQLTLNPQHLGPIEVSVDIDNGNASVSFASANAEVRDAIETAMPRLREMFASAGIELGQTNVGAESFRQQSGNNEGQSGASRSLADNAILAADSAAPLQTREFSTQRGNGLVDLFA